MSVIEALVWALAALLIIVGLSGIVLPGVPGTVLIFTAALLHKLVLPRYLSWTSVAAAAVLPLLDLGVSGLGAVAGARWGGATRAGLIGAGIGLAVGLFFGPLGMVLGPLLGAVTAEMAVSRRGMEEAGRAALGAGLGILASTAARLGLGLALTAWLMIDCFVD